MAYTKPYSSDVIDELQEKAVEALHTVYDPEIPIDVYELGLIYDIEINEDGECHCLMTLTTPNCPVAESLPQEVEDKLASVEGIEDVDLELTFEPAWSREMVSEEGRFELGWL